MEQQIQLDNNDIITKLIAQRNQNANEALQTHAMASALQRRVADLTGTVSGLKGVIAANTKRIEELEAQLAEANTKRIEELDAQLAEADTEAEELNAAPLPIEKDALSSPA